MSGLQAPQPLTAAHPVGGFDRGVASLDDWLRRRALRNQLAGASRSFALVDQGRAVAFYALAAGSVYGDAAPGRFRRSMPEPIPVVVLGRLAVARSHQGRGIGRAMFQDAVARVVRAADSIGIRGLLVHAISDEARAFCERLGLASSPLDAMTLVATIADLGAASA